MIRTARPTASLRMTLTTAAAALALALGAVPAQAADVPAGTTIATVSVLGGGTHHAQGDDDEMVGPNFRIPGVCNVFPWLC